MELLKELELGLKKLHEQQVVKRVPDEHNPGPIKMAKGSSDL